MSFAITSLPAADNAPLRGGPALRWGVLAPGAIAGAWVGALHQHTDQRVAAVASRSLDRAQQFATAHGIDRAYDTYDQLVGDPGVDIVYVAAPHSEHHRLALLAIAAGKHVLIEKPIAVTPAEAREIAAAARAADVFAMEAMWSRFLPQTTVIARLLADGALGDVTAVTADFGISVPFEAASRMFDPALGGGALLDLGVYPAWFSHFVLGAPSAVLARGSLTSTGVDAQAALVLEHAGDAQSVLTTSLLAVGHTQAFVHGTEARIEVAGAFLAPGSFRLLGHGDPLEYTDTTGFSWGEGLCYQAAAVAHHIADGLTESPLHSLDDAIEVLEVLHEARAQLGAA